MAYVKPNTFTSGTVVEASKIQENNAAVQKYVNGGIIANDITSGWLEPKHIMKGTYWPLMNEYELESCYSKGMPDFPIFHPGYHGKQIHDLSGSGRGTIPNTSVSFYLEADAIVFFYCTISPRPLDINGDSGNVNQCNISVNVNGSTIRESQCFFPQQKPSDPDDHMVSPYRIRTYSYMTVLDLTKGDNVIELVGQSKVISVPLKFYNYTIQAFY